jgi:GGDEF domain-containing protein
MRAKICLTTLAGIILLVVIGLHAKDRVEKQNVMLEQYSESQLQNATELASEKVEIYLSGNMNAVNIIAGMCNKEILKAWEDQKLRDNISNIMKEMNFSDLNICDNKGSGLDLQGNKIKVDFCPYYQKALLGDTSIGFSKFYKNSKNISVIYTVPILQNNKVTAVLRVAMKLVNLQKITAVSNFSGREEVYLLSKDGDILSDLSEDAGKTKNFLSMLNIDDKIYAELANEIKQGKLLLKKVKSGSSNSYISYKGFNDLSDGGIMISIPEDKLLETYRQPGNEDFMLILVIMVIAITALLVYVTWSESIKRNRVEGLAYYDEAIDSINYNRFKKDAIALINKSIDKNYALVEIAIDQYDYIREFFGEQEGLRILRFTSNIYKENLNSEELFSRLNTEYFILLLKYYSKEELEDRVNYLNSKIKSFEKVDNKADKYKLNLHYGIYCISKSDSDIDVMVKRAEYVLSLTKYNKNKYYEFYSGEMQSKITDQEEIEEHMYSALEEKEFLVYLQPKFDLETGMQSGAEALVRWMHPDKGLMYPDRFINVLEKNGFIVKLDMYMLDAVCNTLKEWIGKGYRPMPVSINISRLNLFDDDFTNNIESTVDKYGIPANLIELEIAEEVITNNLDRLSFITDKLKEDGFLISMDDFGTGTTSVNTLYQVNIEIETGSEILGRG